MAAESGDWDVVTKMWMDPSAPPQESPARARIWMIHGARFQMMEYEGSMMGMPFRGTGITGYDNFLKKYVGSWCDSMGTMLMHSEGTFDAAAQALTLESDWLDPLGRRVHMRQVGTRSDDDHMVWTFHSAMAGKPETRFMELHFTRRR
ncbi:MAG: DUF1579 domain-containing protein [Microbacteriaceae bacterium]|nr:DUF1579 domain-containing protein [Microbacteriaceae bacterium]